MRAGLISLIAFAALGTGAAAQISSAPNTVPGTEANPFPVIQMRPIDTAPDHYRRLPYRDLATAIRIEIASAALYDFDSAQVRRNAADYLQQAANLISNSPRARCGSNAAPTAARLRPHKSLPRNARWPSRNGWP